MRILNFLSPRWRKNTLMREFALALSLPFDQNANKIATLHRYLDPYQAPESWLDWLSFVVGLPHNPGLEPWIKRVLIAHASRAYNAKGTIPTILTLVKALTGREATLESNSPHALIAGLFTPGTDAIPGPGTLAFRSTLTLNTPQNGLSEEDLYTLLLPFLCGYEEMTIVYT